LEEVEDEREARWALKEGDEGKDSGGDEQVIVVDEVEVVEGS
jgi:hypothetical protein